MLTLKQVVSKNLTAKCQNAFATARVRNFFEIDPIFPDQNDPDKHLDVKRLPFSDIYQKQTSQRTNYYEHFLREAHKKFPDADLNPEKKRQPKAVKETKRREAFKKLAARILEDPDLGLPYGFGFDEYIRQLKVQNLSSSNDIFLFTLNNLFNKLDATSDFELVQFHKAIIVEKTKHNFADKAKAIILNHLITEVQNRRANKKSNTRLLEKLVPDQAFLDKTISAEKFDEKTVRNLVGKIDPSRLENAAENLAKENIEKTLIVHREKRVNDPEMPEPVSIRNKLRKTWLANRIVNPARGEFEGMNEFGLGFHQYPVETAGLDAEGFRKFEIKSEISDGWVTTRNEFIENFYKDNDEDMDIDFGKITDPEKKKEIIQKIKRERETAANEQFFEEFVGNEELRWAEKEAGVQKDTPLSMEQIYNELDIALENAPLSVKKLISKNQVLGNTKFVPQISHLSLNPDELFWGRIGKYLEPIIPVQFRETRYESAPLMEEVFKSSTGQIATAGQENLQTKTLPLEEQANLDVSELTPEMKREIEIFRQVKNEPYFKHYITNELNYYADRMNDHFAMIFAGIQQTETRPNDYLKYDAPQLEKIEKMVRKKALLEPVLYNGRAYAGAQRKKAKVLAIVKEGTGLISVNRKDFLYYFGQTSERSLVIEPLMVSGYSVGVDVDFFIWGGGDHSQAEAASLALAKALIKFNPAVKVSMRENGLLNNDPRQTERKHVGKYKARAKFPYARR